MAARRVFVNGYGSIGSRVAAFLSEDPEIELVGVAKHSPGPGVALAASRGHRVYVPESRMAEFAGAGVAGSIESALDSCDLVVDASPGGSGRANKDGLYEPRGLMAVYQGGEPVHGPGAVSDILFNSRVNYADAVGARHVVQGSCNVTGMGRVLQPLRDRYGGRLARFDVTLIRRWADIEQEGKEVPDTVEITESPHHGDDVKEFMGRDTPLFVRAVKVPSRQMHLHILDARFSGPAPPAGEVVGALGAEPGVAVLWTAAGTRQVREFASGLGAFPDTNMVHVHANTAASVGDTFQVMYSDDQTGIVIPENHMLVQAMLHGRPRGEAAARTESLFRMAEKKARLEARFARA